jgi:hypothetical protein
MQSNATQGAANTQAGATREATAENARQYDRNIAIEQQRYNQNRSDRQPYMATGRTALAQYLREMGLPGVSSGGRAPAGGGGFLGIGGLTGAVQQALGTTSAPQQSRDQLRAQLAGQYTKPGEYKLIDYMGGDVMNYGYGPSTVDEAGLNAAIDRLMQQQTQQTQQPQYTAENGTSYTDGLPDMESIQTTAPQDVQLDPGYQFGLQQGQQAIDRQFAKQGGRNSGAAVKAGAEYATNYATTGYSAAYGRREDRLNRLQTLAGYGTTPASGSTGQQPNNGNAALISSQGNAAGAAQLAQGNIWGNAINQGVAQYNQSQNSGSGVTMPTSPFQTYTGDYNSLAYR